LQFALLLEENGLKIDRLWGKNGLDLHNQIERLTESVKKANNNRYFTAAHMLLNAAACYNVLTRAGRQSNGMRDVKAANKEVHSTLDEQGRDMLALFFRVSKVASWAAHQNARASELYQNFTNSLRNGEFGDPDVCSILSSIIDRVDARFKVDNFNISPLPDLVLLVRQMKQAAYTYQNDHRYLRFFESFSKAMQNTEEETLYQCDACNKENIVSEQIDIAIKCGHQLCRECLARLQGPCPVSQCGAVFPLTQATVSKKVLGYKGVRPNHSDDQMLKVNESQLHHKNGQKIGEIVDLIKSIPKDDRVILFYQYEGLRKKMIEVFKEEGIKAAATDTPATLASFQKKNSAFKVILLNIDSASASGRYVDHSPFNHDFILTLAVAT
jgi:hypothetical protein